MEHIDDTGFGGIRVIRDGGFGYGTDAVLLAGFACGETGADGLPDGHGLAAADLGSGTGIVPFILSHKRPGISVTGIEVQERAFGLAVRGAGMNGLSDRVRFLNIDVTDAGIDDGLAGSFRAVTANPPYFRKGGGIASGDGARHIARHETTAGVADFAACASRLLVEGGDFYMVHRPSRLVDIFSGMRDAGIEPKEMQLVVPRAGERPNLVLVHGVRGAGRDIRVLPEIAVHGSGDECTELVERIYERI
jgi:tRNA1Val (adenine37-N6)-methyltransferase